MSYDLQNGRTGHLARIFGGVDLPLEVLRSAAGYYLGTRDADGAPFSRESQEYWPTRDEAETALHASASGAWTQRLAP